MRIWASGGEFSRLVEELVTNETYFFRERAQLGSLISEILPAIRLQRAEHGGGPIRVWSAGCASGEEPYSIVMLALESGLQPGVDLRVYASDISERMMSPKIEKTSEIHMTNKKNQRIDQRT